MLAYPDLPEIVEQGGVPDLFHLVFVKMNGGVGSAVYAIDNFGQPTSQQRHSVAMTASRGISAFNGVYAG